MNQIDIKISGPQGVGKTIVAHLLCGTLRALGCKVAVYEGDEQVQTINKTAAAAVHRKQPSIIITTKQTA